MLQPLWARHGQKLQHKRAWRNSNVGPGPPFMVYPLHSRAGRYTHEAILFMARLVGAILYTKATLTFMVVEGVSMEYSKCCCSTVLCTTWYLIHQYISTHTKVRCNLDDTLAVQCARPPFSGIGCVKVVGCVGALTLTHQQARLCSKTAKYL